MSTTYFGHIIYRHRNGKSHHYTRMMSSVRTVPLQWSPDFFSFHVVPFPSLSLSLLRIMSINEQVWQALLISEKREWGGKRENDFLPIVLSFSATVSIYNLHIYISSLFVITSRMLWFFCDGWRTIFLHQTSTFHFSSISLSRFTSCCRNQNQ